MEQCCRGTEAVDATMALGLGRSHGSRYSRSQGVGGDEAKALHSGHSVVVQRSRQISL